jgi:hypothetical protein
MKTLEKINIENFKHSQFNNSDLIDEYDLVCYKGYTWHERTPIGFQFSKIKNREKLDTSLIDFDLLGTKYSVPSSLKNLMDEINGAIYIVNLDDDWDGMGALSISRELYKNAIGLLLDYAIYIFKNYNKTVIQSPEINPVPNGTIDFSWTTTEARLLINVKYKNADYVASCYGYSKISGLSIEGLVDMKNIDNDIASLMKKLKT